MNIINIDNKQEREDILKLYGKIWQIQLYLEYKFRNYNISSAFKGVGAFGEIFAATYFDDFKGSGSAGSGMDLINTKWEKEIEVKTVVTFQPKKCKKCNFKFSALFDSCTNCGEQKKIFTPTDSRFGINAKTLLDAIKKNIFYKLIGFHIYEKDHNKVTGELIFAIDAYDILSSDSTLDYFKNQEEKSFKSHITNLLPLSYDFYRLNPKLFDQYIIKINYINIDEKLIITNPKVGDIRVPFSICKNKNEKETFKSISSYDVETDTVSIEDFSKSFKLRNKNFNKPRGNIINSPLKNK